MRRKEILALIGEFLATAFVFGSAFIFAAVAVCMG